MRYNEDGKKNAWMTREGDEIPYKKLTNKHLANIIRWIDRRAADGMTMTEGGGVDADDIWFFDYTIEGDEVREYFDYKGLMREAKKRKRIKL